MKKLGVVITDGYGFRNFILSDFLAEAEKTFDEVVILSCLPVSVYALFKSKARIIELPVFTENFITWFFRKTKEIAHFQNNRKGNFGIQDGFDTNRTNAKSFRGYATRNIFRFTAILKNESWISQFNKWQQWSFKNHKVTINYKTLLECEKFDLIFFTHQRPSFIAPLAYQAKRQKVKTCSFIFSWDNLASKGRMAADFDYFLVWSHLMKQELQQFYNKVKQEDIEIVGTPQFEPYVLDRYKMSKEVFVKKFNLDFTKKTICFSCGDIATSKNDALYIETIANAINTGAIQDVNFIVRTSPAEDLIRFSDLILKFPSIIWNFPKWYLARENHPEEWSQRIPTSEDVVELRCILEYSDLNINMLSTMSLDFMQFDKPVINTVFGNLENNLFNDQKFLNYAHLIKVVNSKATKIAKNENELIKQINQYLKNPNLDNQNRIDLIKMQVSKPLLGTGKRIAQTLLKWA